jgi:hypothetical protein
MRSRGYSAGSHRMFLTNIIDASNLAVMPDDVVGAVDEARESGGRCLTCPADVLPKAATAFAVLHRTGWLEDPLARVICSGCAYRCDRVELRIRAQAAFHGRR